MDTDGGKGAYANGASQPCHRSRPVLGSLAALIIGELFLLGLAPLLFTTLDFLDILGDGRFSGMVPPSS